ncbi:hypothetical protein CEUSTIGMA_g9049.t1 [Chlamydomonas eustigma]|uniref:Methyltransferase domain-containing protein n=1 Tax=Chlamydomonas eustigma TaxID=1157962 RepID=A0A250XEY5_9CHLO|nr:hypothetical protein CEUSTIGMA_g9049.t1 [Chlamydomonas eustigma]|eukprot:GAX81621.1 hypothetical protein CEUSTIGMA_g9049.t1 [Chlamydomonas eustigma]
MQIIGLTSSSRKEEEASSDRHEYTFFPRCTALSTQYRNDEDAVQATYCIASNDTAAVQKENRSQRSSQTPQPLLNVVINRLWGGRISRTASSSGNKLTESLQQYKKTYGYSNTADDERLTLHTGWLPAYWWRWFAQQLSRCTRSTVLGPMYRSIYFFAFKMLYLCGATQVTCMTATLSDIIVQQRLRKISLLKINVERAEEDVLLGIQDLHWPLIQQVSMQLHDIQGRADRMEALLTGTGKFHQVFRWQEPRFRGSSVWMMYAWRKQPADMLVEGI